MGDNQANKNSIEGIYIILTACGLVTHFESAMGGNKSSTASYQMVKHFATFLQWSRSHRQLPDLQTNEDVFVWFQKILQSHYTDLHVYSVYLQDQRLLSPSTIKNYVSEIVNCCKWGVLYAPVETAWPSTLLTGILHVASAITVHQGKQNRARASENTMEANVLNRRAPAEGLVALQEAVQIEVAWAKAIQTSNIEAKTYRMFMELLYAAMYVLSPQGRLSGILDMKKAQGDELLNAGYSTSAKFKTHAKYGLQPVTLGSVSKELLHMYLFELRPQVCRADDGPAAPLFLTYEGKPDRNLGRSVTAFFTRTKQLHINTTMVRSLVETNTHKLYLQGKVTAEQRAAVGNINGHGSAIIKNHYIKEHRAEDVLNANIAFASFAHTEPAQVEGDNSCEATAYEEDVDLDADELCDMFSDRASTPVDSGGGSSAGGASSYSAAYTGSNRSNYTPPEYEDTISSGYSAGGASSYSSACTGSNRSNYTPPEYEDIISSSSSSNYGSSASGFATPRIGSSSIVSYNTTPTQSPGSSPSDSVGSAGNPLSPYLARRGGRQNSAVAPAAVVSPAASLQVMHIGSQHPDINAPPDSRARWTDQEIERVGTWCVAFKLIHKDVTNVVAACLKMILKNPDYLPLFHPNHILDCTRLRNGWREYQKKHSI